MGFKVQIGRGAVSCIATHGRRLLVSTDDDSVHILECTYGPPAGILTNLTLRHTVRVKNPILPLKCCYSPSGQGYLVSATKNMDLYSYSLAQDPGYKMLCLRHHQVPVVAVAVSLQDTLLASADSMGRIVLWRRIDFTH